MFAYGKATGGGAGIPEDLGDITQGGKGDQIFLV
jgi:hypothetical protein